MATSGRLRTTSEWKHGSYGTTRYLTFNWEVTSQSIANNTTTIAWEIVADGTYQYGVSMADFLVKIDGDIVYETDDTRDNVINPVLGTVIASGTKTISHAADGTKTFTAYIECGVYVWAAGYSGTGSWSLTTIPRGASIVSAQNFTDEQNPTITYSNPAGSVVTSLEACIAGADHIALISYRAISKTGTSYTFSLTDSERTILRNYTSNSNTAKVNFYIRTVIAGQTFTDREEKTLTIVNANPIISPTAEDTNSGTVALTGNPSTIIRGNNLVVIRANAVAQKGATIASYSITNGAQTADTAQATFKSVENNVFTVKVTDSRGNSTTSKLTVPMINYVTLTCNPSYVPKLVGEATTQVDVTLKGNYFNGAFSSETSNEINLHIRHKKDSDSDWGSWIPIMEAYTPSFSNNTYSLTFPFPRPLDYQETYLFQCMAQDRLLTLLTEVYTVKFVPVFDWGKADFNFNVPVTIEGAEVPSIVEQSLSDSGWSYRKWSDGTAECWRTLSVTAAVSTATNASWYSSGELSSTNLSFPFTFMARPAVTVQTMPTGQSWCIVFPSNTTGSTTKTGSYQLNSMSSTASRAHILTYMVKGRWK